MAFTHTGAAEMFVVPMCVAQVTIEAWGAEGGKGTPIAESGVAGRGAQIKSDFAVTAGATLVVEVGGVGQVFNQDNGGGGGGGRSEVRIATPSSALIVAGGGGGASGRQLGNAAYLPGFAGGDGGLPAGGPGAGVGIVTPPGGGTQTTGGIAGTGNYNTAQPGSAGSGGFGGKVGSPGGAGLGGFGGGGDGGIGYGGGGGGGGGYFGGGGGDGGNSNGAGAHAAAGGGGGSSFSGGTNLTNATGVRTGNGQVIITW